MRRVTCPGQRKAAPSSWLEELAERALRRGAGHPAIEWDKSWISWEDLRHVADRAIDLLEAGGVPRHAPVAVAPRNRPAAVAALLALIAKGHTIRMIHVYQSAAGIARDIVRLKPAAVLIGEEDLADEICPVLRDHGIAGIVLSGMGVAAIPGCERFHAEIDPLPLRPQIEVLTSGTTGTPKPFAMSFDLIARDMAGMNLTNAADLTDPGKTQPMFLFYPFGNFSGLYSNLASLLQGIPSVLVDRFNLADFHDYILRYRPSWGGVPPSAIPMMLEADIPPADLESVRFFRTGSAPLDPSALRAFEERYGKPVLSVYGATEFGGPVTHMSYDMYQECGARKFGTVGKPFGGAQLRVIDPDSGAILGPGQLGLLEVVSPRLGTDWIRTTDLGVIDEDGFVFIRGRADGAIMRGGFKLLPETIEHALGLHEAVFAAGVTGLPDKRLGHIPAAAIQLRPGAIEPTIAELENHLRAIVEATHIPGKWRFVEALPCTAMLKVDRAALRALFEP